MFAEKLFISKSSLDIFKLYGYYFVNRLRQLELQGGVNYVEINQLQYFVEICNCGSISKAANKVHLSQQGLSSSVRRLEAELGCDLFYRKGGTLVLTEVGALVFKESQKLLKHSSNIYEMCENYKDKHIPIRVMLSHSILPRLSPKLQTLLLSSYPNMQVDLKEMYSEECIEAVENEDVDFAIVYGKPKSDTIECRTLDNLKQVFIVNKRHPFGGRSSVSIDELDGLSFIAPEEPSFPRQMLNDMFKERGLTFNVAYSCGRPRQVLELISNNTHLISRIVESEITEADKDKISLLELKDIPFSMPISLLYKKNKSFTGREKTFLSLISDAYKP